MGSSYPRLIYHYYRFPKEANQIKYVASGRPQLTEQILELVKTGGISAKLHKQREFDYDISIPLMLMYPKAHLPPREGHLLPLHVCYDIVCDDTSIARVMFNQEVMGKKVISLLWR